MTTDKKFKPGKNQGDAFGISLVGKEAEDPTPEPSVITLNSNRKPIVTANVTNIGQAKLEEGTLSKEATLHIAPRDCKPNNLDQFEAAVYHSHQQQVINMGSSAIHYLRQHFITVMILNRKCKVLSWRYCSFLSGLLLWSVSSLTTAGECEDAVQNKIAWDYNESTRWSPVNLANLCKGAEDSEGPAECFKQIMFGGVDWGGGTQWNWQNALRLCQGAEEAPKRGIRKRFRNSRVSCFKSRVSAGVNWSKAIDECTITLNAGSKLLRAKVSRAHMADYSRAAVNIEAQVGDGPGQINIGRDTGYRFRLHGANSGGPKTHYQGVGFLRDATVGGKRYRRAVLSYNYPPGLMVSAGLIEGSSDGVTFWDANKLVRFQDQYEYLDIMDEPSMGNHHHPGGLQSHGDLVAIAMEEPKSSGRAAVYFIRFDGLTPRFVSSLLLGTGGAPSGLNLIRAASSGFLKLESGYLLAISGANDGKAGIWFYHTESDEITASTKWAFIDYWTPDRMPEGVCNIDQGKHATNCFVGGGGGTSLLANDNGDIYLMITTGTASKSIKDGKDDEYAQLYRVVIKRTTAPTKVNLEAVWSGKEKLGRKVTRKASMRWAGAAQTTASGRLVILNTERGQKKTGARGAADGVLRISE